MARPEFVQWLGSEAATQQLSAALAESEEAECCQCGAVEVPAYVGALNDEGLADCVCSDCLDRLERRHWDGED